MNKNPYHLFGIRHHGPGSARMLLTELERLQPDCLLIEGPPEANGLLQLAADAAMQPPVALLIYVKDNPKWASFFPFTIFSPEWQALLFGIRTGITVRFMDLPQRHQLAAKIEPEHDQDSIKLDLTSIDTKVIELEAPQQPIDNETEAQFLETNARLVNDPLGWIALAAGYADGEAWWERFIEERQDTTDVFPAIQEIMTTLRQESSYNVSDAEKKREAYMRETMRQAAKDGFQQIAVICGAWHLPALAKLPPATQDRKLLKNLPKINVIATWIPWTYQRIAIESGYNAGITAPGYYEHIWYQTTQEHNHTTATYWLVKVANLLRQENIDCSSAHLIEAVRLADTLAAFREYPTPGINELNEAIQTVICFGDPAQMQLIEKQLLVGERLGQVPETIPLIPLVADLMRHQKRLRLKQESLQKKIDLDLRKTIDLERSHLLHRLTLLKINWGTLQTQAPYGAKGTFH
ncbi:hypothetical protein TI05_14470, partial [Achromatium sp. WMS3]